MSDSGLVNCLIGWTREYKRARADIADLKRWLNETGYFNAEAVEYLAQSLKLLAETSDPRRKK